MITNKYLRIHLSAVIALLFLSVAACSTKKPAIEAAPSSPPPDEVIRQEPVEIVNSEPTPAAIEPVAPVATPIREGVPDRYTVKKGDTLWDISKHFLNDPWLWPEVWYVNPGIRNPHLIYPGEVIALSWVDGKPVLSLEGMGAPPPPPRPDLPTVKLSPSAKESKLKQAINTIPKSAIAPFLNRPFFIHPDDLQSAPYIAANYGEHVVSAKGQKVYARRLIDSSVLTFNVVRIGQKYIDPDTKKLLGYEAMMLGTARLTKVGDPSTLIVTDTKREILNGDYLIPIENENLDINFFPRAPSRSVAGRIISVADGVQRFGQYHIVVINKGAQDGLEPGSVLEIFQQGELVRQPYTSSKLQLPEERAGLLMIFKTYEELSYGLVMEAFTDLSVNDYVYSP